MSNVNPFSIVREPVRRGIWFIALATLLAAATSAQEPPPSAADLAEKSLEDLLSVQVDSVFAASRHEQKVTEAPASVTIVTADEIRKRGYRTLADVLRDVRGFYVTYDRNYTYVGVRGFARPGDYNTRVLLLVDGHRLNDNIYDSAYVGGEFPLDLELVERIEVVRGPSSSLYGTSAFFAVINVVTRRGSAAGGTDLLAEGGSFETWRGRAAYDRRFGNGIEVVVSASRFESRGPSLYFPEFDDSRTNGGVAEGLDDESARNVFAKAAWGGFTLQGAHVTRDKGIPTASFGTIFNDGRSRTTDTRAYLDLAVDRSFGALGAFARVYYDRYDYDGAYVYDYSETDEPFPVVFRDYARGHWWGAEAKATVRGRGHTFTAGAEYRDNLRQDQGGYDDDPFYMYFDDRRRSRVGALYAQDELRLGRLLVSAGLRHDSYDTFGGTTNPRFGLILQPGPRTALKLLHGRAFRAPNAFELYYYGGGSKGNAALRPEKISTSELVFEQYLSEGLRFSLSAFDYETHGLIAQVVDPEDDNITFQNLAHAGARGVEVEAEGRSEAGFALRASYSFQDARDSDTREWLSNSPRHLAQLRLSRSFLRARVFADLGLRGMSARRTLAGGRAPGFVLADLSLRAPRLAGGLDVFLDVRNLLDTSYADPGAEDHLQDTLRQDGRTVRLGLRYRF
jgi:iron complex outermembrane receptor protein